MGQIAQLFGLDWKLMLTVSIGFFVLLFIMMKFAWPAVTKILEERANLIKSRLDDAEARRAEMERMRNDYEQRLTNIETEARERIQSAVQEAHAARDQLLSQARAQSEQILERAKEDVQREKEKALIEIRDRVADLATMAAGQIIRRSIDPAAHRQLIDEVIDAVGATDGGRG